MEENLKTFCTNLYQANRYIGSNIPNKNGIADALRYPGERKVALTYSTYGLTREKCPPIELIKYGQLTTTSFFECIEIRPQKDIEQVLNVLKKAEGIDYEFKEDLVIIQINNDNESKKFAIATTRKGISILNTFEYLYALKPEAKVSIKTEAVMIVNAFNMFMRSHFNNYVLLDITHLEKITNIKNPNTISKIYKNIKPMVDKYFFSDLSLNNIYYDKLNDKYVIFGISDFIEHSHSCEIMIDLDAFLNGGSLYCFKKTGEPVNFDEYLIYRFGFSNVNVKREWEVL